MPKSIAHQAAKLLITTPFKPLHPWNADWSIKYNELGRVTEVRLVQPLNVCNPMVCKVLGKVSEVRPVQP